MPDDFTMTLRIPRDLAEDIETYWHYHHLPSRVAAIRDLLRVALETETIHYDLARAKEQRR